MAQADRANVVWFDDAAGTDKQEVGGKGANLSALARAGFDVPPGFTVSTAAYEAFMAEGDLASRVQSLADTIDYNDAEGVEHIAEQIREVVKASPVPAAVAEEIKRAYNKLGSGTFVAVRSSATSEDSAEASFAGLHDSYLDIEGDVAVVDAVRSCWGSLWTGRAAVYRHRNGFSPADAQIGVVVQRMIDADVAGVIFTGNPRTTATDEMVLNANWGLGESVVQGMVTPDEYTVSADTLKVIERVLGSKTLRTVRDPKAGVGTVEEDVPEALRHQFTLSDDQVAELARVARRIQEHYEGFPQDIEWVFSDGAFFIVQSRPITGVEFSWDADVDGWQPADDDKEILWTRGWADLAWTGAISPLFYSIRAKTWTRFGVGYTLKLLGHEEAGKAVDVTRSWKFHKSEAYYNTAIERRLIEDLTWPSARPLRMYAIAQSEHEEVMAAPFKLSDYVKTHIHLYLAHPKQSFTGWFKPFFGRIYDADKIREAEGLSSEELPKLSDVQLRRYAEKMIDIEVSYYEDGYLGFVYHVIDAYNALALIMQHWYDGPNQMAYVDLISGVRTRTETQVQNLALWDMAEQVRGSAELTKLFEDNPDGDFFAALETVGAGRELAAAYADFVAKYPHRGHDDRDIIYTRRGEDPAIDYQALQSMLSGPSVHPEVGEKETNDRREKTYEEVLENIKQKPFGFAKAEAFKFIYDYMHKFIPARDDERDYADKYLYAQRLAYLEIGRRLVERGVFDSERDVFFLSRDELYPVLESGGGNVKLLKAKIAARARDFDRFYNREANLPMYLKQGRPVDVGATQDALDGVFVGSPTSRGTVTGTARLVKRLKDIGRVKAGEIMVCNSTDPGWTPVFTLIKGIVTETGGIMSHASCLAREYGFPAVVLENGLQLVPDGATITVNGDSGTVTIVAEDGESPIDEAESTAEAELTEAVG